MQPISKFIVFDLDGVLVDSWSVASRSMSQACALIGVDSPPLDRFRELMGLPLETILNKLDLPVQIAVEFRRLAVMRANEVCVFPGVTDLLVAISVMGIEIGVLTGKDRERSEQILGLTGLDRYVSVLITPDDAPPKPNAESLHAVLNRLKAEAAEAIYVGDASIDMQTARAAGVRAVFATWGAHLELDPNGYDYRVETPSALHQLLKASECKN